MFVRVSTPLAMSADAAWATVQRSDTLRYILRGVLGVRPDGPLPERWREGHAVSMRLWFFHVIPGWRHTIRFVRVDDKRREILTSEVGGPVSVWNHQISVKPETATQCRYSDEIEIHAGLLTPAVALFAQAMYRYRQRRWRRLADRIPPRGAGHF